MTTTEKRRFIRQLVNTAKKDAIKAAARMPQSWDGHELREYLADYFLLLFPFETCQPNEYFFLLTEELLGYKMVFISRTSSR